MNIKQIILIIFSIVIIFVVVGKVEAYSFSLEPWTQLEWNINSEEVKSGQVEAWIDENWSKKDEFIEKPWEKTDWSLMTQVEKVYEQVRFQYLRWRVGDNRPAYFLSRYKKVVNINTTKDYFIPEKTSTEWTHFETAVNENNLPDLSFVDICSYGTQVYEEGDVWTESSACSYSSGYSCCDTCSVKDYVECCDWVWSNCVRCDGGKSGTGYPRDRWKYKNVSCNCSTCYTTYNCNSGGSVTSSTGSCR